MNPLFARNAVQLLLILILFISFNITLGQTWSQKNNGMFGGYVTDILVKGDTIFVTTESNGAGLYISTDDGNTWQPFETTLEWPKLLALKQDTIFAATSGGVFYSNNNGISWVEYRAGMGNPQTESLEVVNETLLAGTYAGLFRSTHRTKPWTLVTEGLPVDAAFTEVRVTGDKLFGIESDGKLYTSDNEGASWEQVEGIAGPVGDVIATEDFIIAGGLDTVYVSVLGTFWSKVGEGLSGYTRSLVEKDGIIYAGTSSGLYSSDDHGVTFTRINIPELDGFQDEVGLVSVIDDAIFITPLYRGLFRSEDGVAWTEINQGLNANQMMHIHQHDGVLYASTFDLTYKSVDKGDTWEVMNSGSEGIYRIATKNDSIIAQPPGRDYLAFSTDGGDTWSYETPPGEVPYLLGTEDNIVCVSSGDGLLMLGPDNEWKTLIPSDVHLGLHGILAMGDTLVTWSSQGIYFSTDFGTTWNNRKDGLPQEHFSADEAVHHNKKVFVTIQGWVFRTEDLGLTWSEVGYISPSRTDYLYSDGEYLYAGTYNGVFATPDDGISWMKVGEGLDIQTREMAVVDGELFAATKQGVWSVAKDLTPQITSFSPAEGTIGTIVEIKGKYFASYLESNVVTIGGDTATVLDAFDNNTIVVSVPEGATIGKITVTVNNHTGESEDSFCLKPTAPVISMLSSSGNFPLLSSDNDTENHEWFVSGQVIPNVAGQFLDAAEFGPYTVRVSNGLCFSDLSEEFCVLPPAPTITATDNGDGTITLTSSSPSDNTWLHNGMPMDGFTDRMLVTNLPGGYSVGVLIGSCLSDISNTYCINPATPAITASTGTEFPILTSNTGDGNQWFLNGEMIEGATDQQHPVQEPGEYTLQVSLDICVSDMSDIFCVTPTPVISVQAINNAFPVLTSSFENNNQWFLSGEPISDATLQDHQTTEPGPYTVKLVTQNCESEMSSVYCVNPETPTVSAMHAGSSLILTSSSPTGNQWYNNGVAIPQATEQTFTVTDGGTIIVKVLAGECYSEPSLPFLITGVEGTSARSGFGVYPVPATHMLYVDLHSFTANEPVTLTLHDNVGAAYNSFNAYGGSTVSMPLTDIPSGVYYLEATSALMREVKRVIVK